MNIEQEAQIRRSVTVYLPEDVRQKVEAIAGETEHSMSKMVSILVREALARRTTPPSGFGFVVNVPAPEPPQGARVQVPKVKPKGATGG